MADQDIERAADLAVPQVQARIDLTVGGLLAQPAPEEPDDE